MEVEGLISIIVPVYNAKDFLTECIDSILRQSYQNYELILIDDGSSDGSWDIINAYADKHKKVIGYRKENGGPNSARKKGLELATGEFVMFVDADDYVDGSICDKLAHIIINQQVDIVLSKPVKMLNDLNLGVSEGWPEGKYSGKYIAENIIDTKNFYVANMLTALWAHLYRAGIIRSIFRIVDLRIDLAEDFACLLLALLDSKYVFFLDESLYYYRQNSNSILHKHTKNSFMPQKYLYQFLMPELEKRAVSPDVYKQLEWLIFQTLLLKGYEAFKEKEYLFPFKKVQTGSTVVIYGAGVFGGELFRFINQYHTYNAALWVDQNWEIYQKEGLPVSKVQDIRNVDYDYIVIAVLKPNTVLLIKEELEKQGISPDKVAVIDQELISYKELPDSFWEEKRV